MYHTKTWYMTSASVVHALGKMFERGIGYIVCMTCVSEYHYLISYKIKCVVTGYDIQSTRVFGQPSTWLGNGEGV